MISIERTEGATNGDGGVHPSGREGGREGEGAALREKRQLRRDEGDELKYKGRERGKREEEGRNLSERGGGGGSQQFGGRTATGGRCRMQIDADKRGGRDGEGLYRGPIQGLARGSSQGLTVNTYSCTYLMKM